MQKLRLVSAKTMESIILALDFAVITLICKTRKQNQPDLDKIVYVLDQDQQIALMVQENEAQE